MAKRTKTVILTAEQLQQKWATEAEGKEWVPAPKTLSSIISPIQEQANNRVEEAKAKVRRAEAQLNLANDKARKGSPDHLRAILGEVLKAYNVQPAEELIKMAIETDDNGQFVCDRTERIKIWTELLQYQMPKLKAVEVSGQVDHSLTVVIQKFDGSTEIIKQTGTAENPFTLEMAKPADKQAQDAIEVTKFSEEAPK